MKEDVEQNEDEDEGLPLYILAERLFNKEENRRQDVARQRFATTMVRTDSNNSTLNRNITSHRNTISRHSGMRGSRGIQRGKSFRLLFKIVVTRIDDIFRTFS